MDNIINKDLDITFYEKPFKHWIIPNFFDQDLADAMFKAFPKPDEKWWKYSNHFEKKYATDNLSLMHASHAVSLMTLNSHIWIKRLEEITGIDGIIADPWFRGGGLHCIPRGGKLDIHADYNFNTKLKLDRRLNMLIYLNKDWKEEYLGNLELWDADMTACQKSILPSHNLCVIFETVDWGYHGHPDPLNCPETTSRKSLALYYFTNGRPDHEKSPPHSTKFQKRPSDETTPEIEMLRERRNMGRLL